MPVQVCEPTSTTVYTLDTSGCYCPEPVMMLHQKLRKIPLHAMVEIVATDPSTQRDIPRFCHYLHHQLQSVRVEPERFIFRVKKMRETL